MVGLAGRETEGSGEILFELDEFICKHCSSQLEKSPVKYFLITHKPHFTFYSTRHSHSALNRRTPDAVYFEQADQEVTA